MFKHDVVHIYVSVYHLDIVHLNIHISIPFGYTVCLINYNRNCSGQTLTSLAIAISPLGDINCFRCTKEQVDITNMIISCQELLVYFIFRRHDGSSYRPTCIYIGDFGLRKFSVPNIKNTSDYLVLLPSRESYTSRPSSADSADKRHR